MEEKDGLPDKAFYDVVEDDDGIIWLASDKGLYRYDGYSYTLLTHPNQRGLAVFNLVKDVHNQIWFTNLSNQLFVVKNGVIQLFGTFNELLVGNLATLTDVPNHIVISSGNYLIIVNKQTGKIVYTEKLRIHIKPFLFQNALYVGVSKGEKKEFLYTIDLITFETKRVHDLAVNFQTYRQSLGMSLQDEVVFFVNGLRTKAFYKLTKDDTIIPLQHQFPPIRIISIQTISNELWFCTEKGVIVCTLTGNTLHIKNHFLQDEFASQITKDQHENYWVSTTNNGVFVIPNPEIKAIQLPRKNDSFKRMFVGHTGNLLFSTIKYQLFTYTPLQKSLQHIQLPYQEDIRYVFYDPYEKKYNVEIEGYQYILLSRDFDWIANASDKLKSVSVKEHAFMSDGQLMVSTNYNFAILSADKTSNTMRYEYIDRKRSYACLYDEKNKYSYYSNTKGLFVVDAALQPKEITCKGESVLIQKMTQTRDGRIWCLSFKKGIFVLENNEVITNYSTENGLLSNFNSHIASFENHVWIAGEKGLQQIDFAQHTIRNLTKNDGIPSYEFTGLHIQNHQVYVSTRNELCFFDERKVFKTIHTIEPYFTSIEIADSVVAFSPEGYHLKHHQNKIKIKYNTNGFLSKNNVNYIYKLSGVDPDWQKGIVGINEVLYNSLPAGNFVFELKAFEGENISKTITIQFQIAQVYYKTWWFYALITILIIFVIWYVFYRMNKQKNKRQQNLLAQQTKDLENIRLKLESLRSQMNPHFIFNALNSIQDYIIQNEKSLARRFLVKFSELIRMYLEHSQRDTITISEEIEALQIYLELEKERFETTFSYQLKIAKILENSQVAIPTFLIQPYIENAITHGLLHKENHRNLHIKFETDEKLTHITCTIIDNGIGRAASEKINKNRPFKPKSFSTMANQKRIDLLNKTNQEPIKLRIIDNFEASEASGTTVIITIPTQKI
ncbi:MAG: histidine kinase [Bacteroidota bacterium]